MQYRFFHQTGGAECTGLVLHFNGWAMPPEAVQHLRLPHGYDLLVLWDYRTDALDPLELGQYEQIHLTAWSMGVWAADRFLGVHPELRERIGSATAVAGTGYPVNDLLGIPRAHCEQTLSELTEENRPRFNRRTCEGKSLACRTRKEIVVFHFFNLCLPVKTPFGATPCRRLGRL